MKTAKVLFPFLLVMVLVSSCTSPTPPATPTLLISVPSPTPLATTQPTIPTNPPEPAATTLRIRMITSSDWTEFFIHSPAAWHWQQVVSASSEAIRAEILDNHLLLEQSPNRAESGKTVEMNVEVDFPAMNDEEMIGMAINRGGLGYTRVEISRYVDDAWVTYQSFTSESRASDGENILSMEIPAGKLLRDIPPLAEITKSTEGYGWWDETVFYELFVRSFYDSNGDGIGDLNGVIEKLDYLNDGNPATTTDLGITGIWLRPINPSHSYHGYDITDYYGVNPDFGTMQDFQNLLTAAHERGIRVIIDLVLNHSGSYNPWFLEAEDPNSDYYDWFIWSDSDPGYVGSWSQQVWFPAYGRYFYSTFSAGQPDLNYTNPEVTGEMYEIARFWLEDIGVDGFRLDAAKHIIEEGTSQKNTASTHAWYQGFRTAYKQANPEAMTVGEIWEQPDVTAEYLQGDELDLAFDFYMAFAFVEAVNNGNAETANNLVRFAYTTQPAFRVAPFLTNYDLNRLMTQFGNQPEKVKVAASMMLTAPGVPFIYYGEEIGMQGTAYELVRLPMQWSDGTNAGFSTAVPWKPVGQGWETFNVANENNDPESIFSHFRSLIQIRGENSALRTGNLSLVATGNPGLYSILRENQEESILVLANLTGNPISSYGLSLASSSLVEGTHSPLSIMGEGTLSPLQVQPGGGFTGFLPLPEIPPYTTVILKL